jgi:hypothetical protein
VGRAHESEQGLPFGPGVDAFRDLDAPARGALPPDHDQALRWLWSEDEGGAPPRRAAPLDVRPAPLGVRP